MRSADASAAATSGEVVVVDWGDAMFVGPDEYITAGGGTYAFMDPQFLRCAFY
jgi:hypothetical protein